ncbi:MAG: hypothetical protein HY925_16035 [Elusimicrobia bacterium]|nr:hypothetical protein [Elusimicrobiota bacterium]
MRGLLLGLFLSCANASDWLPADPGGAASDSDVSAPDKLTFWERLQDRTFDGLCRQAKIPLSVGRRVGDFIDPGAGFDRYLRQLPTGELAIIDEVGLSLPFGWLPRGSFDRGTLHANFDLELGARIQGRSIVVRRLESPKACAELSKLADFRTIKTALPATAERIAGMAVGEIWQLPVEFRVGVGGGLGDEISFPLVIGLGAHREAGVTVTLRRLDEATLRFRLRLESANVYDARGRINANIPVLLLGLPGGETAFLGAVGSLSRGLARSLNEYLAVQLNVERGRSAGTRQALEYVLDPRDSGEMEKLARAIKGDLSVLALLKRAVTPVHDDPWEALEAEPSFEGEDRWRSRHAPFKFQVPFLARFDSDSTSEADRVFVDGGEYSVFRSEKRSRRAFLSLPVLGDLYARDAQKNADVVVRRNEDGTALGPAIVYVQQEGFIRQDGHDARAAVERANGLLSGSGKTALPVDRIAPPSPRNVPGAFWRESEHRRGVAALTVVMDEEAVRQVLRGTTRALLLAYVGALEGPARTMGEWLLEHARTRGAKVEVDRSEAFAAARAISRATGEPLRKLLWTLWRADRLVEGLSAGLFEARRAPTAEARAGGLARRRAGGRGRRAYGDALRVLLRLVNPANVSAEFLLDIAGGSAPGSRSRWTLHADAERDPLLDGALQARNRFRAPSLLSD